MKAAPTEGGGTRNCFLQNNPMQSRRTSLASPPSIEVASGVCKAFSQAAPREGPWSMASNGGLFASSCGPAGTTTVNNGGLEVSSSSSALTAVRQCSALAVWSSAPAASGRPAWCRRTAPISLPRRRPLTAAGVAMTRLDSITKYRHGSRTEMQRAFEALAMQIQRILHPQDDVTQLDACHA
jgi:hypothetical protein